MKRFQILSVLPLAALSLLAGCGPKQTAETPPSTAPAAAPAPASGDFKVALLTTGPVTDGGWNQSAYDGLLKIQKDLGAQVDKQESLNNSQFEDAFRDFANRGYNVIFAHGDEFGPAAEKVAKQYPKTIFVTTGGTASAANLAPIHFATEEGTYLQGMEAAFVSKSGKGGFIGGQNLPPVKMAADAFANGAKSVNPKFNFQTTYINGWTDPVAAKAQTEALLSSGADVIAHNCDAAAKGMFDTAGPKPGVYTFGVNADENPKAANVLSSAVLDVPKAFADIAADVKAGKFQGHPISLGLKEGDVTLVDNPKLANVLTADQKAKVAAAAKDIADGKIKVAP
ncbi:BMP family ABC transporter substrate-binding protein [Capsulimonas corticalis]|uniref:BMP family ABC transporter substrate-binding protein n=1 Tax=Capsulimonas corticalis TaxID=2219043 RepID=A0A402CQQ2_9BACT|nr:BMP family protein [Capsulimonas corticalis]BDI32650.1 BMP family ABC transporter substrate-binding protein [Capsulimonas corticalis]